MLAGFPPSVSPSSHAVEADGFVFLTGQFPRDLDDPEAPLPDGIAAQTTRTMGNLDRALGALGSACSTWCRCACISPPSNATMRR